MTDTTAQPRNPLHGKTLEALVTELADFYGWEGLGECINIRCFTHDPSVGSSLKFLRKTPWARDKVESLKRPRLKSLRTRSQRILLRLCPVMKSKKHCRFRPRIIARSRRLHSRHRQAALIPAGERQRS